MLTLPEEFINVIVAFAPLFTQPVWEHAQVLLTGAILTPCKRTVSACLRVMGLGDEAHFQNYHRVLNRARWSALAASRVLLGVIVTVLAPTGVLVLGLDDTIERRRGELIACQRHLPRSGAILRQPFCEGQRVVLVELDGAG